MGKEERPRYIWKETARFELDVWLDRPPNRSGVGEVPSLCQFWNSKPIKFIILFPGGPLVVGDFVECCGWALGDTILNYRVLITSSLILVFFFFFFDK